MQAKTHPIQNASPTTEDSRVTAVSAASVVVDGRGASAFQGVVLALGGVARWTAVAELFAIIDDLCAELGISGTVSPERDERLARLRVDAVDAIGESEAVAAAERGRGLRPTERIGRITALASSAVLA